MRLSILASTLTAVALCAIGTASIARAEDALQPREHDYSIVHAFSNRVSRPDGELPISCVLPLPDGSLMGTTQKGGTSDVGTIYRIAPDGAETLVHEFRKGMGGYWPGASCLLLASDGHVYGTTSFGGTFDNGIVFRIEPDGSNYTVVHAFDLAGEGMASPSSLVEASDGNFYGTSAGGHKNAGVIFGMTPVGDTAELHVFRDDGYGPNALLHAKDGNLYGTTTSGGGLGGGTFFRVRLNSMGTVFRIAPAKTLE